MTGQGRPRASRQVRALVALAGCWLALTLLTPAWAQPPAPEQTLRLRLEWGGGAQRRWEGTVTLSKGTLTSPQALGVEADTPGSVWLDEGTLIFRGKSPRAYDGVDVTVSSPAAAQLVISLVPQDEAGTPQRFEIPLADLSTDYQTRDLDDQKNRLLVRRTPGDKLRVTFQAPALVFAPGEKASMELEPYLLGVEAGAKVRCELRLTAAGETKVAWSLDRELTAQADTPSLGLSKARIELPRAAGVYNLAITALTRNRLGWKETVAERTVQLVVVDPQPPGRHPPKLADQQVAEIDPSNPAWWQRFAAIPLLPGLKKGPWGNVETTLQKHPLGQLTELPPATHQDDIAWQAYPIPISNPGSPYRLEVEYAGDLPQSLGISVVEPNSAGAITPIGLDSGVYVPESADGGDTALRLHRLTFWPRTTTPVVLITNRGAGRAAFGKMRIYDLTTRPQPAEPVTLDADERLLAGYYDRPLFPENFSAPESLDTWSNRSLDDWSTFYQAGLRLVDQLRHAGHNGLLLTVLADGSAIYPSTRLGATPRYDTGTFFSTGQDPVQKDVLEMLFRLFDREGLRLVPVVQFAAPLPELEAMKRDEAAPAGLEWIGRDGAPWLAGREARRGLAPYYNPLDPRVREAMLGVVGELAERYGAHASFAGLGLQLSAEGYAQLPGPQWGFDDQTVARFQQDTGLSVPGKGPRRFAARADYLLGKGKNAWLAWRAEQLEELYRGAEKLATAARPQARLYLAGTGLLRSADLERDWRPALPRRQPLDRSLLDVGIAADLGRRLTRTVLLRPQRIAPLSQLATQGLDLEFNESPELDRFFRGQATPGGLFLHEPQEARLPSFDAKSPYKKSYTWLVAQMSPSGDLNRRRFVHSLAALDSQVLCDGGWLLPLGQEESLADFVAVYRRLPAAAFETIEGTAQPVTIRSLAQDDQTFVYLANDSRWKATVRLRVAAPPACNVEGLSRRTLPPLAQDEEGGYWELDLAPYELVGARLDSPNVKLSQPQVTLDEQVAQGLEGRIAELQRLTIALLNPAPLDVLDNPGFDAPAAEGQPAGWTLPEGEGVLAALDDSRQHDGTQSLRLTSEGQAAQVRSSVFDPPRTGRLSISVWLRVADTQRQPPLRLAVEGQLDGQGYYRHAPVGAGQDAVPIAAEWAQYVFHIADLPVEGLSQLRVRFDLMGSGEVWIDHVQLFDLVFSKDERIELDSRIIALASAKLRNGEIADCQRLLDGYWPRFLAAHVAAPEIALAPPPPDPDTAPADPETGPPPPQEAKRPTWIDRLKSALPF